MHRVFCSLFFAPENNYNIDKHLQVRKQNTTMSPDGRLPKMPGSSQHDGSGHGTPSRPRHQGLEPKRSPDESEMYKNRLQAQKFSVGKFTSGFCSLASKAWPGWSSKHFGAADYPDPLSPRPPHPQQYPVGTDPELEQILHSCAAWGSTNG